jgi:hypothetical protein
VARSWIHEDGLGENLVADVLSPRHRALRHVEGAGRDDHTPSMWCACAGRVLAVPHVPWAAKGSHISPVGHYGRGLQ